MAYQGTQKESLTLHNSLNLLFDMESFLPHLQCRYTGGQRSHCELLQ